MSHDRHHNWQHVFTDALGSQLRVGVLATIRNHVGGEPSRSEVNAGRRAAHSLARRGDAVLVNILASPRPGRPPMPMLVLARPGVDLSDPDKLIAVAGGEPSTAPSRRPSGDPATVVPGLVKALNRAIDTARLLDLNRVTPAEAADLAVALTEPLEKMSQIRNQLRKRARSS